MQTFWKGNTFSIASDLYVPLPASGCPAYRNVPSSVRVSRKTLDSVPRQPEGMMNPQVPVSSKASDFHQPDRRARLLC